VREEGTGGGGQVGGAYLRLLVDSVNAIVVGLDSEGKIAFFNRGAETITGYTAAELSGRDWFEVLVPREHYPEVWASFERAVARGAVTEYYENPIRTRAGEERIILWRNSTLTDGDRLLGTLSFGVDVTEARMAERRAVQAERMATVGVLAAGVAHEINNPLTYLLLNVDLASRQLGQPDGDPAAALDHLREVREAAERVARIVRDLRSFSRATEEAPRPTDLRLAVRAALRIVGNELRHRAEVELDLREVPPIQADEGRLIQIVVNLVANAAQALSQAPDRRRLIRVTTRTDERGGALLEVMDTGCGIPADQLEHIFEPFYTTKPIGLGTGLGLSVVHGIVTALGGAIEVDTVAGEGTTFRIELPAAMVASEAAPAPEPAPPPAVRRRRVLVIDDEPLLARAARDVLMPPHEVDTALGAGPALDLLAAGDFDAILCDVMMPGMDGLALHAEIARRWPGREKRILFMTGGVFDDRLAAALGRVGQPLIHKPFDWGELLAAIDQVARDLEPA
jgi:PAS domain S-box-containing protein